MKSMIYSLIVLTAASFFTGCKQPVQQETASSTQQLSREIRGSFTIEGAFALYPLMIRWTEAFHQRYPYVTITVNTPVTRQNLNEHFDKGVDLVMLSRDLTLEEDSIYWSVNVAKLGVIPIISKNNPYLEQILQKGITHEKLCLAFISEKSLTWGRVLNTDAREQVHTYYREKTSGASWIWSHYIFQEPENLQGEEVVGDDLMINKIQNDPLGLGFCNIIFAFDPVSQKPLPGIQLLSVDYNYSGSIDYKERAYEDLKEYQRAVSIGKYPRSLCRYLTIVSKEKPGNPAIQAFLNWIVNEGQEIAYQTGYSPLHGRAVQVARQCLMN